MPTSLCMRVGSTYRIATVSGLTGFTRCMTNGIGSVRIPVRGRFLRLFSLPFMASWRKVRDNLYGPIRFLLVWLFRTVEPPSSEPLYKLTTGATFTCSQLTVCFVGNSGPFVLEKTVEDGLRQITAPCFACKADFILYPVKSPKRAGFLKAK